MECAQIHEALSARLDGEAGAVPEEVVDAHLRGCSACRAWAAEVVDLHRVVRVRGAEPVPDLSAAIIAAFHRPSWHERMLDAGRRVVLSEPISRARWALFVVGLTQLVLAVPALLGDDRGATIHIAREIGSFDVALAVGLLVAAWQPARAWGLLPLAVVLVFVMAGSSVLDVVAGRAGALGECQHLLDVAGVGFLWSVAREARPAGRSRRPLAT
jgi:predicted anti-sigma-YlaC factor YlaD